MDRDLDPSVIRRQRCRQLALGGTVLSIGAVGYLALAGLVSPSVERAGIRTAVVDAGPVDSSIAASGVVVPEIEQVITSPVEARVLRILERLREGQPIVQLDVSQARLDVEKLTHDLAIKANSQAQKRLALQKSLIELDSKTEVKKPQLASLESQLRRDQQRARRPARGADAVHDHLWRVTSGGACCLIHVSASNSRRSSSCSLLLKR